MKQGDGKDYFVHDNIFFVKHVKFIWSKKMFFLTLLCTYPLLTKARVSF